MKRRTWSAEDQIWLCQFEDNVLSRRCDAARFELKLKRTDIVEPRWLQNLWTLSNERFWTIIRETSAVRTQSRTVDSWSMFDIGRCWLRTKWNRIEYYRNYSECGNIEEISLSRLIVINEPICNNYFGTMYFVKFVRSRYYFLIQDRFWNWLLFWIEI